MKRSIAVITALIFTLSQNGWCCGPGTRCIEPSEISAHPSGTVSTTAATSGLPANNLGDVLGAVAQTQNMGQTTSQGTNQTTTTTGCHDTRCIHPPIGSSATSQTHRMASQRHPRSALPPTPVAVVSAPGR